MESTILPAAVTHTYLLACYLFKQRVNGWHPQLVLHLDWQQHIKVHTRHLAGPTGPVAKNPEQQHGKK